MSAPHILPTSPVESEQQSPDFVLFEDLYSTNNYRYPTYTHPTLFTPVEVPYTDIMGDSGISDSLRRQDSINKQYYALGTSTMSPELPIASSAAAYESHPAYSPFNAAEIPRSYIGEPMTSAPGVLIHPPTMPYHSNGYSHYSEYRSTPSSASPATSVGGYGSEAGSGRNSPYHAAVDLQSFPMIDPAFHAGIDPSLVSNSPSEPTMSAGSPYHSPPSWNTMHSPPRSNASSPDLRRQQSGRLSPASHAFPRPAPYPTRRSSVASVHSSVASAHSRRSPSASICTVDHDDSYGSSTTETFPGRSPSSRSSGGSSASGPSGKEGKDTLCLECNKSFRDLRAHQLTHQLERPEKCPIATCEYSKKGFARKYDCQRHTLTHYKGTMVCDFCAGAGTPLEKSYNRADVFKRHLMAMHNVEQSTPNGRQKKLKQKGQQTESTGEEFQSGRCSTCNITFPTAQQFYEHLDDCVLSKVVEAEPSAIHNDRNLSQVKIEPLEEFDAPADDDDDAEEDDEEEEENDDEDKSPSPPTKKSRRSTVTKKQQKSR